MHSLLELHSDSIICRIISWPVSVEEEGIATSWRNDHVSFSSDYAPFSFADVCSVISFVSCVGSQSISACMLVISSASLLSLWFFVLAM